MTLGHAPLWLFVGADAVALAGFGRLIGRDGPTFTINGYIVLTLLACVNTFSLNVVHIDIRWHVVGFVGMMVTVSLLTLGHPAYLMPPEFLSGPIPGRHPHQRWMDKIRREPTRRQLVIAYVIGFSVLAVIFAVVLFVYGRPQ
jgi:hypothetical protein